MKKNTAYAARRHAEIEQKKARRRKILTVLSVIVVAGGLLIGVGFLARNVVRSERDASAAMEKSEDRTPYVGYWWMGDDTVAVFREDGYYCSGTRQKDGRIAYTNFYRYAVRDGRIYLSPDDTGNDFAGIWTVSLDGDTMRLNGQTLTKGEAPDGK